MELKEFIERYLPDYHKRLEELYAEYRWWDRPVTNEVLCEWYSKNFRESFSNYNNQLTNNKIELTPTILLTSAK